MYTLPCTINATPIRKATEVPISGLVLTFDHAFDQQDDTINLLNAEPTVEVGAHNQQKCAIVIDSPSKAHDQKLFAWVQNLPGVADVQITFVGFDDEQSNHTNSTPDSPD